MKIYCYNLLTNDKYEDNNEEIFELFQICLFDKNR